MKILKKYPRFVKFTCLTTLSCGVGWLCFQIKTTKNILSNALDTSILTIVEPTVVEKPESEDFYVINWTNDNNLSINYKWTNFKYSLAKRLLVLANSENKYVRKRAIRQLAKVKELETWQYSQLASMIDAKTAVGLARTPDVDQRLFMNPPLRFLSETNTTIINAMKDLLINLHAVSEHPCMGYFISKAFLDVNELEKYGEELSSYELKKYIQNSDELLPMCLESLLHHASVGNYAKDIAALNGLPLLMEIQKRFKDNLNVNATICRIISYLSMHKELLEQIYISGWITVLAQWVKHEDVRISIPASKALANLDYDENVTYLQRLYPLHPSTRVAKTPGVDVIFIHGLLGGVFFTWRQRKRAQSPLGFIGKNGQKESLTQADNDLCLPQKSKVRRAKKVSDPEFQEYIEELEKYWGHDGYCKDFDVVWEDIPTKTNDNAVGPYCCTGKKFVRFGINDDCFTNCWPRDWLAQDCDRLRIIGVNYETNLSLWTPICPVEKVKTLGERSDELIEQLERVHVGDRPIVWVTHSMGGLLVKFLLCKASESNDPKIRRMFSNTKGIVFFSTPHVGSSVAKFNPASALVIWPSVEVQELQKNSPQLIDIHKNFLELVKTHPIKITTFVETRPTVVSAMKFKFLVVDPDSGNPGCGEYYEVPLDHLGICKPASRYSFLYQKVLGMIEEILTNQYR